MGLLRSATVVLLGVLLTGSRDTTGQSANHPFPPTLMGVGLGAVLVAGLTLSLVPLLVGLRRRSPERLRNASVVVTEPGQHEVRFASVGGAATAKATLLRVTAPLRSEPGKRSSSNSNSSNSSGNSSEHERSGKRLAVPGALGAVLHGPPGSGKTLLAQALAGELNLPLYVISGAALSELGAGAGAAQVHELFALAGRRAPCVIFIDDLDALASQRADGTPADREARAQTVQKLILELDNLTRRATRLVVLGALRDPERIDPGLVRPGRLGRLIPLSLPDERERADIIALLACAHPELCDLDAQALAACTANASALELRQLLSRLAQQVAERHRLDPSSPEAVVPGDLEQALTGRSPPAEPG